MTQCPKPSGIRGATLLEVMVALGILATSYVALMQVQSGSIRLSTYGKQLTVATFLAQAKIEEIEETLVKEGFPDMDHTDEGTFEEQGYPHFKWQLEVLKVELPLGAAFDHLLTSFGQSPDEDAGDASSGLGSLGGAAANLGQFSNLMGGAKGGGALGGAGGAASMLSPDMLRGQVDMLTEMLEQAIREVRLTVIWNEGGPGDTFAVTTHLVQVPQAQGAAGAQPGTQPGAQPGMKPGGTSGFSATSPTKSSPFSSGRLPAGMSRGSEKAGKKF